MRGYEYIPDEQFPDIRPGDVVRLKHGQILFTVTKVERTTTYAAASLRPVEPLTASGRPRAHESRRTDHVVLVSRPDDSQPLAEIPWEPRDMQRELDNLMRQEQRENADLHRANARLARLEASGIEVVDRRTWLVDSKETYALVRQWRNGPILCTRLTIDRALPGRRLLELVRDAENWLDDLAAGEARFSEWDTSGSKAPTRGIAWGQS